MLQELEFLSNKVDLGVRAEEMHLNDQICLESFRNDLSYDPIKQNYTVALPWKQNKWSLATNEAIAYRRMQQLQRKFMLNPEFGIQYAKKVSELLTSNLIEEVYDGIELGDIVHYLPHTGVLKTDSKTTSLRIVMDASSKANASELSLNDCLYTGPNLISSMNDCLLGFRLYDYAATADLEKAFLKLIIRVADSVAM